MNSLGEAVTHLPWLAPCAGSLTALAKAHGAAGLWPVLRRDPGCLLLLARFARSAAALSTFAVAQLRDATLLEDSARLLGQPGFVDWRQPRLQPIYNAALASATVAARLSEQTGRSVPEAAWLAGLLAPLGTLAVCAVDPAAATACLADPAHAEQPLTTQRRWWGMDQAAIARRLARRWQLPPWLGAVVGHLALPADAAVGLGADLELFRLIQLTVGLLQRRSVGLGFDVGTRPDEPAAALGLSLVELDALASDALATCQALPSDWTDPASMPLLRDLLDIAAEHRRLADAPVLEKLEADFDALHQSLARQRASEAARLQLQKLSTLAEFAAGAGHEINNPLAVISGQAQYLMNRDESPVAQHALQKIVGQTQRIHDILSGLMQFARPSKPQKRLLDVGGLVRETAAAVADSAQQRQVRLVCPELESPLSLFVDPRQIRMALTCLLRNAVEAAPAEGWAGIRVVLPTAQSLEFLIEDSGPGPAPQMREHLFDPFFSGRQAGRGRGLGLPTAWRMAREHGGDVVHDERAEGLTRFVLRLPYQPDWKAACLPEDPATDPAVTEALPTLLPVASLQPEVKAG
ncbi:MAG: HDOD domain-containing protein [Planctomycetia bacterium]|nr:HDOD domain-containing protein [Planctomycetia bacterium]